MKDYKFEVTITDKVKVVSLNEAASDLEKEWSEKFPNKSILIFILNNPNELDSVDGNKLTYIVSESFKEETFEILS